MKRILIIVCVNVLLTLAIAEIGLRVYDPTGLVYFDDLAAYFATTSPTAEGYALPIGDTALPSGWSFTMTDTGRTMPSGSGERVDFVGDSVAFGWAVADEATFAYTLAEAHGLNARNLALPGYSAENVARVIANSDADHIIYLSISNDHEPFEIGHRVQQVSIRLRALIYTLMTRAGQPPTDYTGSAFTRAMDTIAADKRVTIVAFDDVYGRMLAQRWPVVLIAPYTGIVSAVDTHPNADGHREIGQAITPILESITNGSSP